MDINMKSKCESKTKNKVQHFFICYHSTCNKYNFIIKLHTKWVGILIAFELQSGVYETNTRVYAYFQDFQEKNHLSISSHKN